MKKIVHCLPGAMKNGGIEKVVMEIISGLETEYEFGVLFQTFINTSIEEQLRNRKIERYLLPIKSKSFFKYRKEYIKSISNYDIVHIHAVHAFSYFEAIWALKEEKKVIVHSHNSNSTFKRKVLHYLLRPFLSRINVEKVAVSNYSGKWLFGKKNNFTVIYNGMNCNRFIYNDRKRKQYRKLLNISDDTKFILVIGRVDYQKDPLYSLQIAKKLTERNINIRVLFVGEGSYKDTLVKKIKVNNLESIVQSVSNSTEIPSLLSAADIFLLPSRYEGLSIATIEAQLSGIDCFISDTVDPKTKINNNVWFLSKKKIENWVEAISKVSQKEYSRNIDLEVFKNFSYDEFYASLRSLYEK